MSEKVARCVLLHVSLLYHPLPSPPKKFYKVYKTLKHLGFYRNL